MSAIIYKLKCIKCDDEVNVIKGFTDFGSIETYNCTKCNSIFDVNDNEKPICKNCASDKSEIVDINDLDKLRCHKCNNKYKKIGTLDT